MDCSECMEDFKINAELQWEPVELLQNRGDVVTRGGLCRGLCGSDPGGDKDGSGMGELMEEWRLCYIGRNVGLE